MTLKSIVHFLWVSITGPFVVFGIFAMLQADLRQEAQRRACNFTGVNGINTEHVQGLGANGKAAFSPKAHG